MTDHLLGTIVHYIVEDGPKFTHGRERPALVVEDGDTTTAQARLDESRVNLLVFMDGTNDGPSLGLIQWRPSRQHGTTHRFGTWHFVEECPR